MPLLARRAASATERTLVYFRTNMYIRPPTSVPTPRIKAYRVAAGLGPSSGMGHSRHFEGLHMTSGLPPEEADIVSTGRHVSKVPATDIRCLRCGWTKGSRALQRSLQPYAPRKAALG